MALTFKSLLRVVLLVLILVLACNARRQQNGDGPIKIETLNVSNVEVTLNYFDRRLLPLDSQIKDVIKLAFVEAARVFGGLPKDLSGNVYREFRVNMRRDPDFSGLLWRPGGGDDAGLRHSRTLAQYQEPG